ncbi:MAG TPA: ABC transporter ATP-binding protein [Solirubrobacterales bacterium]|nr:ABC transporter ATP-binding protein [Solirubrobacterales bacterium]
MAGDAKNTVIEVRDLEKSFRIPTHRVDSLKERMVRPFAARDYRELRALDGISFDVHQGEFFGIVGRNGSGKSTLLKLLASIYRADAGTIRMAGRLAPFIELGVGFNTELTARENVVLNGVMMGLTPQETRRRLDAVLDFAELRDFADLKLKNYSSGMLVRLAFSVMLQADADIMLIDEVLAVGDAAFQQKCSDAFRELKAEGKTIVLVTHEMTTVEEYCHRAMLIGGGEIRQIGDPAEIGRQYLRLNFQPESDLGHEAAPTTAKGARLLGAWFEDAAGERVSAVERGERLRLRAELEIERPASGLGIGFIVANADGVGIFEFGEELHGRAGDEIAAGERILVRAELANPLAPGHYYVHCGVHQNRPAVHEEVSLYAHAAADFVVFGTVNTGGVLALEHEIESVAADGTEAR